MELANHWGATAQVRKYENGSYWMWNDDFEMVIDGRNTELYNPQPLYAGTGVTPTLASHDKDGKRAQCMTRRNDPSPKRRPGAKRDEDDNDEEAME